MSIRPVRTADHAGLNALHRAVWWPERSPAGWRWLEANPARGEIEAPIGWVIDDGGGEPAAFLGNFVQRFWQGDRLLHGATGFSIIVPPAVRGASGPLVRAFMAQPGLFARYTFNANRKSCPIYARFGLEAWPTRTHALKLSWIVDPVAMFRGRMLREAVMRLSGLVSHHEERFLNDRLVRERRLTLPANVRTLDDLGDASAYAVFWERLRAEGAVLADRSPAMLRWRLSDPDMTLRPLLLTHVRDGTVTGYAMAQMSKGNSIEPAFLEIIDLVALADDAEAIPMLTTTLLANARAMGAAKVRLQMVNDALLGRLGSLVDRARREGGWGHCHAAIDDPALAGAWSPTPFDGDYGFCLRPVPLQDSRVSSARVSAFAGDKASA